MNRKRRGWIVAVLAAGLAGMSAMAAPPAPDALARQTCAAITARVAAIAGDGSLFLRSYDAVAGTPTEPALADAAFAYDNALAIMALLACGEVAPARRIGGAFVAAVSAPQARLRNVYRAGAVERVPLPNGWWDARAGHWVEDAQQMGTATGNVAWVALALLALDAVDPADPRWRTAARRLADWVLANARDERGAGGFNGGLHGFDAAPERLGWKSTEHNVDLVALFDRLAGARDEEPWRSARAQARRFVDAQWDAAGGHFITGTLPDGVTPNRDTSGLDAQLWPLLLRGAPPEWRRALAWAERAHGVDGGFDFNADRDGLWVEGTAQAALAYRVVGRDGEAAKLLATIARERDAGGYLNATRETRISTGLAVAPDSAGADFHYFRRPHLGATAWAALAATATNPFAPPRRATAAAPAKGKP